MASISNNDIARAIYLASKDKNSSELGLLFQNVAKFLFRRRLLSKSGEILLSLKKLINQMEGILEVKIWSKNKINDETKKELTQILKRRYKDKALPVGEWPREVFLQENLDEKLLGGLRIEVNDELIDLTLKNKINKLQEYLTDHE